jgi:hypothetical protein
VAGAESRRDRSRDSSMNSSQPPKGVDPDE